MSFFLSGDGWFYSRKQYVIINIDEENEGGVSVGYQALYRVWRPQQFIDVVGQEHVTTTLQNALMQQKVSHAYLFSGPRGTGKTSAAKILAKAVNCEQAPTMSRPYSPTQRRSSTSTATSSQPTRPRKVPCVSIPRNSNPTIQMSITRSPSKANLQERC